MAASFYPLMSKLIAYKDQAFWLGFICKASYILLHSNKF